MMAVIASIEHWKAVRERHGLKKRNAEDILASWEQGISLRVQEVHREYEADNAHLRQGLERLDDKMECGHKQRFVISADEGTNYCAACSYEAQLAEARAENGRLREVLTDLTLACAEAARTLEVVDPNAPSLEQADTALGKHIRYTGPIMRAEATRDD